MTTSPVDGADSPTINGASVLQTVRRAIAEAEAAGESIPGRPALVKLTGATDHQVQKALAVHEYLTGTAVDAVDSAVDGHSGSALPGGKLVAWFGFGFGSIVSILANVLAARIAPHDAPADWKPNVYAQVGAAVWPIAMLLAVEVLSRIRWPKGKLWNLAGYGGVGAVAAFSAVISYQHVRDVLTSWGYPWLSAGVGPLVIDGLMVASGFALLATANAKRAKPVDESPAPVDGADA